MKKVTVIGTGDMSGFLKELKEAMNLLQIDYSIIITKENIIHIHQDNGSEREEKYLLLNIDNEPKTDLLLYEGYIVITVGFNNKASITVSSVEDDEIAFCIQRSIIMPYEMIEPQELIFQNIFKGPTSNHMLLMGVILIIGSHKMLPLIKV